MKNSHLPKRIFVIFLAGILVAFAPLTKFENELLSHINTQLGLFYQAFPQEKAYLHLDKPYYAAGETVWLKAYLATDVEMPDSLMSKVLYVELITPKDTLHRRLQLKVENGSAYGNILLPEYLQEGNYLLRAYTSYMRNLGEDYFFEKKIRLYQPKSSSAKDSDSQEKERFEVQFFPEGGDLVSMLRSTVGIKAVNRFGQGVPVAGSLYEKSSDSEIVAFKSNHLGIGSFKFYPLKDKIYVAKIQFPDGSEKEFELPKVQAEGVVLGIDNTDKQKVKIKITANLTSQDAKARELYLIAQQAGKVYFYMKGTGQSAVLNNEVSTDNLPSGVVHFTLFDGYGKPHCERLVFVWHEEQMPKVDIISEKTVYKPREKVNLKIGISYKEAKEIEGDLSLAVIDAEKAKVPTPFEENILTYFGLSAELKGKIEQPAYYFQGTDGARQALDKLMLTQGWRRFKWKEVLANQFPTFAYPIEQSLYISGKASGIFTDLKNGKITILSKKLNLLSTTETDENGNFFIAGLDFADTADITLQALSRKDGKMVGMTLDKKDFPQIPKNYESDLNTHAYSLAYLENYQKTLAADRAFRTENDVTILKAVTVKDSKIDEEKTTINRIHSSADAVIKGDDIVQNSTQGNVLYALQGRIAGVQVSPGSFGGSPKIRIRGVSSINSGTDPLFLFDGMQVDANFFAGISPNDVASIEVLKGGASTAIYGIRGAGGVIAVYSKRGDGYGTPQKPSNIISFMMAGYDKAREFYQPRYDTLSKEAQLKPDLRTTIYWNPSIKTQKNTSAEVSFFCADSPTTYKIILEGITQKRQWVRKEMEIQVEK